MGRAFAALLKLRRGCDGLKVWVNDAHLLEAPQVEQSFLHPSAGLVGRESFFDF